MRCEWWDFCFWSRIQSGENKECDKKKQKQTLYDGFWYLPVHISQAVVANPGSESLEQTVGLRNEECQLRKELMCHKVKVDKPAPA